MNRRDAIERVAWILGGTVIGTEFFVAGCKSPSASNVADLSKPETIAYMDEIAETILPRTNHAGRKRCQGGQIYGGYGE